MKFLNPIPSYLHNVAVQLSGTFLAFLFIMCLK